MIRAELELIKRWMTGVEQPILDLGSSTLAFRQRSKLQYDLAALVGQPVVSFDAKDGPGVDVVGDAENLHWHVDRRAFGGVICTSLLEHVRHPWLVVYGIAAVLRFGGRCIITAPWVYPDHADPEDNYRFSVGGLRALATAAGLKELAAGPIRDGAAVVSYFVGER